MIWLLGMPDWLDAELLIVFAMAAAGVYTMISEGRANRREAEERIAMAERIATLEATAAQAADVMAIVRDHAARIDRLGADEESLRDMIKLVAEIDVRTDSERPLLERIAAIETELAFEGRLATLEARADHKPWTATRHRGKFAKTEPVTPPEPEPKT